MASLAEKVAIVTGASRGIGRAIAEKLAQEGATVVVNYSHSADKAQEVVSAITAQGGKAIATQADISRVADISRLFQETVDKFGKLDILVNNAGISLFKPLAETTEQEFDQQFALNAKGTFFALQEAALKSPPSQETAALQGVRSSMVGVQPNGGQLKEIAALVDSGKLKPYVETVLPLKEARQAHELSQSGRTRGKIVLQVVD